MSKNRNIIILSLISFLQGMVFYCSIPALYRQQYGLDLSEILLIESISWIITFLLEVPWGYFSDRYGYRKTLIISNFVFFLSKIIFYLARSFPIFLLERVFLSVAISGISGSDSALLYESSSSDSNKEKHFGYVNAIGTIGLVVASLSSPLIIAVSMKLTAFLTIFPYAIATLLSFALKDISLPVPSMKIGILKSLKRVSLPPRMILFIVLGAAISEFSFSAGVMLNQAQYTRAGIPVKYFGLIYAFMRFIPVAAVSTYKLIQQLGRVRILASIVGIIILAGATLSFTSAILPSVASVALIILSSSLFLPLSYGIKNEGLSNRNRATVLSVYAVIEGMTAAGINFLTGQATDISIGRAFLFQTLLIVIISSVYFLSLIKKLPIKESCPMD